MYTLKCNRNKRQSIVCKTNIKDSQTLTNSTLILCLRFKQKRYFDDSAAWSCRGGNTLWIFLPASLRRRSGTLVSGADDGFVTEDIKHWDYGPRYSHQGYEVIHTELGRITWTCTQSYNDMVASVTEVSDWKRRTLFRETTKSPSVTLSMMLPPPCLCCVCGVLRMMSDTIFPHVFESLKCILGTPKLYFI